MEGRNCPICGKPSQWLSTTNEWEYYCPDDKIRFNKDGKIQPAIFGL